MTTSAHDSLFADFLPRGDSPRLGPEDGLLIREAADRDLDALARIAALREGCDESTSRHAFETLLMGCAVRGGLRLVVAERERTVLGFGKIGRFEPPLHAPSNVAPAGWYLTGLVVAPRFRRLGVGDALTEERLRWIAGRSPAAYYFANAQNGATIALHRKHGFVEVTRSFHFPGVSFQGGRGILFRVDLGRGPPVH